jgi:hypothetical protein
VTTDAHLPWAVLNNAKWCDLVCRAHGIQTRFAPDLWATSARSPRFYPDAVTLQANVTEATVLEAIASGPGASVKDSYATLELAPHGFEELFEARWITHQHTPPAQNPTRAWTAAETNDEFTEWTTAAGLTDILDAQLLRIPDVRFLVTHDDAGIAATALAYLTGPVVGVSNVFARTIGEDEAWAGIPAAVAATFPSAVLVGYEHGESLRAAVAAGFREAGPLRVWLAPPAD